MVYHGIVSNGVIVLDGAIQLQEGAIVRVECVAAQALKNEQQAPNLDPIFRMSELAIETGIPDLASRGSAN